MKKYLFVLLCLIILGGISACTASYANPSRDVSNSDLVGVWETTYEKYQVDTLTIRGDGTYKQTFEDTETGYLFETDWSPWWLEYFTDGRVYIHFEGGRYYPAGVRIAELDGMGDPCPSEVPDCISENNPRPFYDPYTKESIDMFKELMLSVRVDPHGKIIFNHMWTSSDRGFAIFGGQSDVFRQIDYIEP